MRSSKWLLVLFMFGLLVGVGFSSLGAPALTAAATLPGLSQARPAQLAAPPQSVIEAVCVGTDALFKSKGDMRRMLQQGGVYLNGRRLTTDREPLAADDLLGGEFVLVRKGTKTYGLVKVRG